MLEYDTEKAIKQAILMCLSDDIKSYIKQGSVDDDTDNVNINTKH